jgi:hypothetical protein
MIILGVSSLNDDSNGVSELISLHSTPRNIGCDGLQNNNPNWFFIREPNCE